MAKFKVGDKVKHKPTGLSGVVVKRNDWERGVEAYDVKSPQTRDIMQWEADDLVTLNSRVCNSTNPIVRKAMNAVARNSTEDLHILLQTADTDIDDGDIDEAKQILRETRTRAIRSGYTREWMEVAKRVGMNASVTHSSMRAPFALNAVSSSDAKKALDALKRAGIKVFGGLHAPEQRIGSFKWEIGVACDKYEPDEFYVTARGYAVPYDAKEAIDEGRKATVDLAERTKRALSQAGFSVSETKRNLDHAPRSTPGFAVVLKIKRG